MTRDFRDTRDPTSDLSYADTLWKAADARRFPSARSGQRTDVTIFGQKSNPTTWRLAHMNLAIHGIEAKNYLGPRCNY